MEATPNGPAGHALLSGGLVHFVTVETGQLLIYCWRMQVNLDKKGLAGPAWDKAAPALVAPVDLDGIGPIATHTWWATRYIANRIIMLVSVQGARRFTKHRAIF